MWAVVAARRLGHLGVQTMSRGGVYALAIIASVALEVAAAPAMQIAGCRPLFLLIAVLVVSLDSGIAAGSITGFLLGLLFDLASSGTVGAMALTLTVTALLCGAAAGVLETSSPALLAVVACAASVVVEFTYGIVNVLTSSNASGMAITLLTNSLPSALYTAVIAAVGLIAFNALASPTKTVDSSLLRGGFGPGSAGRGPRG